MSEISVRDFAARRAAGEPHVLLDVREPDEVATAAIAGATVIRMAEIPQHLGELPADRPIVVMCHHGSRSAHVAGYLNANGFANAINLDGGIDAWSREIDPGIARY